MESPSSKKYGLAVHCIMWGHSTDSSATELISDKPGAGYVQQNDTLIFSPPTLPHLHTKNLSRDIYQP